MIYISKVLKPWVYESKSALKDAYDECWRQKEEMYKESAKAHQALEKILKVYEDSDSLLYVAQEAVLIAKSIID
tara:strand:+ start:1187 stop:1408 length:222 start_codon:yes stop_codon:yes gene_type:complete